MRSIQLLFLGFFLFTASAATARAVTEKDLVEAARKDGVLQVTSNKLLYSDVLLEAFAKKYPFLKIRHEKFDAATMDGYDTFESKDPAERSDVMLRCQDKDLMKWTKLGWLASIDDLPNWKERPRRLEDDKRYVYFIGSPHVIVWNPEKVSESEVPSSYAELLEPRFRSKLVMRNPLAGNSPAFFVQFINHRYGGAEWFEKLGKNSPFVAASGPAVHTAVQDGGHPIGLSRDLEVMTFNKYTKKTKLKFKAIEGDLPYQYQLGLMSSNAPHKAAARLFMNWLVSKEAQAVLEQNGFSVGSAQSNALARKTTWQWQLTKGDDYNRYRGTLFGAQRALKHGGATLQEKFALSREEKDALASRPGD
jgi:iron(III) transport system substrate-binding protein